MARTLFFVEALALAALSLLLPIIASQAAAAFVVPFALSLILPLACVLSVWPARAVRDALLLVFSAKGHDTESGEAALILESLGTFSKPVSVMGMLLALAVAAARLPLSGDSRIWSWLGAYLSLYALVNVTLWQALAAVAKRNAIAPAIAGMPASEAIEAITESAVALRQTVKEFGMARFLFGTAAIVATFVFLFLFEGGNLLSLLMLSPFLIVILVPAFAVLAVWSIKEWGKAWRDGLARGVADRAPDSAELWAFYERMCYLASVVGFILGLVIILSNLGDISTIGRPLAVGLMTPVYAILFGIVARILRARVEKNLRK